MRAAPVVNLREPAFEERARHSPERTPPTTRGIFASTLSVASTRRLPPSAGACKPNTTRSIASSIDAPAHMTHGSSVDTRIASSVPTAQAARRRRRGRRRARRARRGCRCPRSRAVVAAADDRAVAPREHGTDGRLARLHALLGDRDRLVDEAIVGRLIEAHALRRHAAEDVVEAPADIGDVVVHGARAGAPRERARVVAAHGEAPTNATPAGAAAFASPDRVSDHRALCGRHAV